MLLLKVFLVILLTDAFQQHQYEDLNTNNDYYDDNYGTSNRYHGVNNNGYNSKVNNNKYGNNNEGNYNKPNHNHNKMYQGGNYGAKNGNIHNKPNFKNLNGNTNYQNNNKMNQGGNYGLINDKIQNKPNHNHNKMNQGGNYGPINGKIHNKPNFKNLNGNTNYQNNNKMNQGGNYGPKNGKITTHKSNKPITSIDLCLNCLCNINSGCQNSGCDFNGGVGCGFYKLTESYWTDCGKPGKDFKSCAFDKSCSELCVLKYFERYSSNLKECLRTDADFCSTVAKLHTYGAFSCKTQPFKIDRFNRGANMNKCLQ